MFQPSIQHHPAHRKSSLSKDSAITDSDKDSSTVAKDSSNVAKDSNTVTRDSSTVAKDSSTITKHIGTFAKVSPHLPHRKHPSTNLPSGASESTPNTPVLRSSHRSLRPPQSAPVKPRTKGQGRESPALTSVTLPTAVRPKGGSRGGPPRPSTRAW